MAVLTSTAARWVAAATAAKVVVVVVSVIVVTSSIYNENVQAFNNNKC